MVFRSWRLCLPIALFLGLFCVPTLTARPEADQQIPRFESDVLPIFAANCLACHGETLQQSGLDLRTPASVLEGGEAGPAVQPGSAEQSLLYEKVRTGSMPLGGEKLKDEEIEAIRRWIEAGALQEGQDAAPVKVAKVTDRDVLVPLLHVRCSACHGKHKQEGGFDVRTRASLLKGGKSGPAIIPGKPDESLLIKRIVAEEMPPPEMQIAYAVRPVTSSELEELREWIAAGAPTEPVQLLKVDPRGPDPLVPDGDRQFWSFQPPQRPQVPQVRGKDLVRTPVDAFLLKRLEAKGLSFSPEADRLVMMRRAYLVLTGLPPEPEEIERYRNDRRPDAYERMIDRLLDSPRYGERWARYWLEAAGYADSEGIIDADLVRPNAYRYRDYVIRSLNSDKPYDRFLMEQIAGDELFDYKAAQELTPEQRDNLVATGFFRMGPDGTYSSPNNSIHERLAVIANQVEIFGSMVMGLTMGCAQCHSHKYDPIPQRDYYRFSAIFRTAFDPYDWYSPNRSEVASQKLGYPQRYLPHVPEAERREVEAHNAPIQEEVKRLEGSLEEKARPYREEFLEERLGKLPEGVRADVRQALKTPAEDRSRVQKYLVEKFAGTLEIKKGELEERFEDYKEEAGKIRKAIAEAKKGLKREPKIRALFDVGGKPTPTYLLRRGDYQNPGGRVEPGVPSVLRVGLKPYQVVEPGWTTETTGRRLALAKWLVQPHHPLTSRVMVNRVWQHHFGRGLVETPGNFGLAGAKPTHPELLDWLATEFVRKGWSLKRLHKLIMTSTVYRQSSDWDSSRDGADPEDKLLSRFPLRRLNADAIRDSILKVAKRLDTKTFGFPEPVEVRPDGEVVAKCSDAGCRRSIYMLQRRSRPLTMLQTFDAPQLNPNCLKRDLSTVSSQALQLWNSEMARENARHFAGRVMDAVGEEELEKQVERIYLLALSRSPTEKERTQGVADVRELTRHWREHLEKEVPAGPKQARARWEGLANFCHAILNSAEFIYVH